MQACISKNLCYAMLLQHSAHALSAFWWLLSVVPPGKAHRTDAEMKRDNWSSITHMDRRLRKLAPHLMHKLFDRLMPVFSV